MINIPLSKILFLDIETVGITYDYSQLQEMYPRLAEQFSNYFDWFPEDRFRWEKKQFAKAAAAKKNVKQNLAEELLIMNY